MQKVDFMSMVLFCTLAQLSPYTALAEEVIQKNSQTNSSLDECRREKNCWVVTQLFKSNFFKQIENGIIYGASNHASGSRSTTTSASLKRNLPS